MRIRAHSDDGFLMVEFVTAMVILTIALLALIGAFSFGYFAIGSAAQTSAAGLLANNQLELYSSLSYPSIALDATALDSAKSSDGTYSTDEAALSGSGADVTTVGCGTSVQCSPVQTLTGPDHKTYKLETFIRAIANPEVLSRSEKVVTVVVRSATAAGLPIALKMQTAFDPGVGWTLPAPAPEAGCPTKCESLLADPTVVNNTTLTIVGMDDQPINTSGIYAPTAYLNGVVPLPVATSLTSGWPQNYVDTYGGSKGTQHELLITITLPSLTQGSYTILVTCADTDGPPSSGDPDQWSWPITVSANGTVTG